MKNFNGKSMKTKMEVANAVSSASTRFDQEKKKLSAINQLRSKTPKKYTEKAFDTKNRMKIIKDENYDELYDETVPVEFTLLDILRMLGGLVLLYSIISKLYSGYWFMKLPLGGPKGMEPKANSLPPTVPNYWLNAYNKDITEFPIEFTWDELSKFYGGNVDRNEKDESKRILLSVKGHIFDVTKSKNFYGSWGTYKKFTGTDCSRSFSYPMWDISSLSKQCSHKIDDLDGTQMGRVDSWLEFFQSKYPEVGYINL
ncbi:hypothetical protein TBLA_0B06310 [Henningerozyma blattae CBS 6284]|uniref:Cytochrome b5 heme-binding domain-containing protein n=1 Tax=Henningerozyma blattae (strain ATCC 34711 / CBS 6284 / DSM 70876 / NBRC 10599 / NRRL Y-10934 / UCD 77-7) TaxID=1071380 RepID=I2GZA3_HENB6|nr:hypothetical protein TBLA_0B06310 [Tetrapisispora blattae CBS 6284]CCH59455.1 hypothetical protein TBLA_0B06310 [Tetrapisispora blattae CBS 6284]